MGKRVRKRTGLATFLTHPARCMMLHQQTRMLLLLESRRAMYLLLLSTYFTAYQLRF